MGLYVNVRFKATRRASSKYVFFSFCDIAAKHWEK